MELYIGIVLWFLAYLFKHDRDASRTNWNVSLASQLISQSYFDNHRLWFTGNLWTPELYYANRLFKIFFLPNKWEWFLAKNVLTFLNDYWKFCDFWFMSILCFAIAYFAGYWWLMFPMFIIGGALHSLFDGSLLRKTMAKVSMLRKK